MTEQSQISFKTLFFAEITEIPRILQQSYFPGLDGLRAISIIIVVISHSFNNATWGKYFPAGVGVDTFYVISGFLITTLLLKEKVKNGRVSLKKFYIRRVLRILPVVYLYLFILLLLTWFFSLDTTPRMFLTAALFISNFHVHYGANWQTGHFWTLSVEEQFYLLFPFLIIKNTRSFLYLVVVILLLLPFVVFLSTVPDSHYRYEFLKKLFLFDTYLLGWGTSSILIGAVMSILLFKKIIVINPSKSYFLSFVIFVAAIFLHDQHTLNYHVMIYTFPVLIGYVIILNLYNNNFFSKILNHPLMVKIGVLSFSIYVWQELFTFQQPWRNSFNHAGSLFFNLPAMLVMAYLSYTFYEKPFLKLKKHFSVNAKRILSPNNS